MRERTTNEETIIGSGVKVEGTFQASGNVTIKGTVTGSVGTENDLHLEQGALIEAEAQAKNAFIAGEIKGNLKVQEKAHLAPSAKIVGDLTCQRLVIEEGAVFNGRCSMGEVPSSEE